MQGYVMEDEDVVGRVAGSGTLEAGLLLVEARGVRRLGIGREGLTTT